MRDGSQSEVGRQFAMARLIPGRERVGRATGSVVMVGVEGWTSHVIAGGRGGVVSSGARSRSL